MLRLLPALLVALLCVTTSGVLELMVPERCGAGEPSSSTDDGTCGPTCLRCHCARPYDVVVTQALGAVLLGPVRWTEPRQSIPAPAPHDVLHVPRPAVA